MGGGNGLPLPASATADTVSLVSTAALHEAAFHATISPLVFGDPRTGFLWICGLFFIVRFLPDTHEFMRRYKSTCDDYHDPFMPTPHWLRWRPTRFWSFVIAIFLLCAVFQLAHNSEFLYFQF
jgi:hypothetical protein